MLIFIQLFLRWAKLIFWLVNYIFLLHVSLSEAFIILTKMLTAPDQLETIALLFWAYSQMQKNISDATKPLFVSISVFLLHTAFPLKSCDFSYQNLRLVMEKLDFDKCVSLALYLGFHLFNWNKGSHSQWAELMYCPLTKTSPLSHWWRVKQ